MSSAYGIVTSSTPRHVAFSLLEISTSWASRACWNQHSDKSKNISRLAFANKGPRSCAAGLPFGSSLFRGGGGGGYVLWTASITSANHWHVFMVPFLLSRPRALYFNKSKILFTLAPFAIYTAILGISKQYANATNVHFRVFGLVQYAPILWSGISLHP